MALTKTRKRRKSAANKSPFQYLWDEAERIRKDNVDLGRDLDALETRIEKEIFPIEQEMGAAIKAMLEKQLQFAAKKSLTQWQRVELDRWIQQNLEDVDAMGLLDKELADKMAYKHAKEADIDIDEDSELSPAEQLDQYYRALDDEEDEAEGLFDALFGGLDNDEENDVDDFPYDLFQDEMEAENASGKKQKSGADENPFEDFARAFGFDKEAEPASITPPKINSDVFKRLFRQTANALHPDKELDESKRKKKHALMSSLLEARRNNDLITIVQLHKRFVDSAEALSSVDEQELIRVLQLYIAQQEGERHAIIHATSMRASVYRNFYAKTKRTVDKKIRNHIRGVQSRTAGYHDFVLQVKTLKTLKTILADRYDYYRERMMDEFFYSD